MKGFLFLYPDKEHINWAVEQNSWWMNPREKGEYIGKCEFLNKVIDRRYRQRGYLVNWVLFCKGDDRGLPNRSSISELIDIFDSDKIISAGISRNEHMLGKTYPSEEFVLAQIRDIEHLRTLRIGGFLSSDCCGRVAKYAYEKGIGDTLIDEDLTEQFFLSIRHGLVGIKPKLKKRREFISRILPVHRYNAMRNVPWLVKY
jgi:hypothetical protein